MSWILHAGKINIQILHTCKMMNLENLKRHIIVSVILLFSYLRLLDAADFLQAAKAVHTQSILD